MYVTATEEPAACIASSPSVLDLVLGQPKVPCSSTRLTVLVHQHAQICYVSCPLLCRYGKWGRKMLQVRMQRQGSRVGRVAQREKNHSPACAWAILPPSRLAVEGVEVQGPVQLADVQCHCDMQQCFGCMHDTCRLSQHFCLQHGTRLPP
jgi:hypothetical protein